MEIPTILELAAHCLLLVLYLSMPPIIAAAGVGTLVALLQALTQVQEQTLSFAIKLFVVVVVIFATARWLGQELYHFSTNIFTAIGQM